MAVSAAIVLAFAMGSLMPADSTMRFVRHEVAAGLKGGYQTAAVDVNGDGRPDLVALASGMSELVWFENPSWEQIGRASCRVRVYI